MYKKFQETIQRIIQFNMDPEAKIYWNSKVDPSTCNLTPKEAFLFSRIDQPITIKNLIQISGMQKEEALGIIQKLLETGLLKADDQEMGIPLEASGVPEEVEGEEEEFDLQELPEEPADSPFEPTPEGGDKYTYDDIFAESSDTLSRKEPVSETVESVPEKPVSVEPKDQTSSLSRVEPEKTGTDSHAHYYKKPSTGEKYLHETGYKFKLGMKAKRSGDLLGAERFIGAAVALNPKISHYWWHLAIVQKDMHKLEEAETSCMAAIEVDEKNRDYLKTLIEIQNLMGKTEEAAATAKRLRSLEYGDLDRVRDLQSSASSWIHRLKSSLSDKFKK